jgi:hypothetical protein
MMQGAMIKKNFCIVKIITLLKAICNALTV